MEINYTENLITVLLIVGIIFYFRHKKKKKRYEAQKAIIAAQTEKDSNIETEIDIDSIIKEATITNIDYAQCYQSKYLLTKNEYTEYKKLKVFADSKGYLICPKVRLLDIIAPLKNNPKYKTLLYKIQSKHVDFVICDSKLYIKAILELDDHSHDTTKRKERDNFVDEVLQSVGYKVIRTRYITEETLKEISKIQMPSQSEGRAQSGAVCAGGE